MKKNTPFCKERSTNTVRTVARAVREGVDNMVTTVSDIEIVQGKLESLDIRKT